MVVTSPIEAVRPVVLAPLTGALAAAGLHGVAAGTDAPAAWLLVAAGAIAAVAIALVVRARARMLDEHARARDELNASRRRLDTTLAAARAGTWTWDLARDRLTLDPSMACLLGLLPGEAPRDAAAARALFADPDVHARVVAALRAGTPEVEYETEMVMAGDQRRWLLTRAHLEVDASGRPVRCLGVSVDVTRRRHAELAREADRARLAAIVDSAMDGVIAIDEDQRVVLFSRAAERIFRCAAVDTIGDTVDRFVLPSARAEHRQRIARYAATGETTRAPGHFVGVRACRADGDEFPMEASLARAIVGGRPLMIVTVRDVTERHQAEATRAMLERRLRQAEKMEALGTLAGGVAHDFNNLLGAVLGHAEAARNELPPGAPTRAAVDEIVTASLRGRELVRQILAFSRAREPARAPVRVADVTADVARLLRAVLPGSIRLALHDRDHALALADRAQLHQVALNLCDNAIQAMPGGGELVVETAATTLAAPLGDLPAGDYARLTVRDTGHGMTRDVVERIFEPFFTTKPIGAGAGLGLSVVHGIVKAHGGAIVVDSRVGAGTTVDVYLPRASAPVAHVAAAAPAPGPAPLPRGLRAYLVDDEPSLLRATRRGLERIGVEVCAFAGAAEALAALRDGPAPDVLITDLTMPGMNGLELIGEARRVVPALPCVLATGASAALDDAGGLDDAGVRVLLAKPFAIAELEQAIRRALAPA